MKTLLDIPDEELTALDRLGEVSHRSRQELVVSALRQFLLEQQHATLVEASCGIFPYLEDGMAFQKEVRGEW